jgi:hypothetical protein
MKSKLAQAREQEISVHNRVVALVVFFEGGDENWVVVNERDANRALKSGRLNCIELIS